VRVSAQLDYALRALVELAQASGETVTRQDLATAQDIPDRYLEDILTRLRRGGIVASRRGHDGGHRLVLDPAVLTVARVAELLDGPIIDVHGMEPEEVAYRGSAEKVRTVWQGMRTNLQDLLESVTVADLADGCRP